MYMHQKKLLKWRILSLPFLMKIGQEPCTIVQGVLSNFGVSFRIHKKSNFDRNQLKPSIQHKNMYIYIRKNYKNGEFSLFKFS